jgi:hypothetical protein
MAREIRCFDDMDPYGAEVSDAFEDLVQDCYHRLIEPPGSNIDDPARGLGLEDMLSGPIDSISGLKKKIENELEKDDRVTSAAATITEIDSNSFRIDIRIVADEQVLGLVLQSDAAGNVIRVP